MKGYAAEIILDQHTTLVNIDAILQKLYPTPLELKRSGKQTMSGNYAVF